MACNAIYNCDRIINVVIPEKIDRKQKKLFEELKEARKSKDNEKIKAEKLKLESLKSEVVEGKEITISYVRSRSTFDAPTSLDTTAYSGGKQVVKAGEKFTLPTKSTEANTGVEGYQLIWYTQDGQTFKGGQEVSFEEDVALYRCNAKECYTAAELGVALSDQNPTRSGILMADMEANAAIGFDDWDTVVMIMNGFNLNFTSNSSGLIGNQRTQRHIYGEGTISAHNPDGKKGDGMFAAGVHPYPLPPG